MLDSHWLRTIYQEHRRELFLAAWTVLRHVESSEDAMHTAFVRLAFLTIAPREPKLYVFRAVRNAAIDLARRRNRQREVPIETETPACSREGESFDAELLQSAAELLWQLDAPSREVIELHLHAGLTFDEISQILVEPLATVASRYRRALHKLGKELKVRHE